MKKHSILVLILALVLLASLVSPTAAQLAPASEGTFTVAVIPDTQHYRGRGTRAQLDSKDPVTNPNFLKLTAWIVQNLQSQRIVFVTHVGDIVDRNNHDQWQVARQCMDHLHGVVPYGIAIGNHDLTSAGDSSPLLLLECNAPDDVLRWAAGIIEQHADQPTTSRGWFEDPKGRMRWHKRHGRRGNTPQQRWDKLFRKYPNIMIVQSGDQSRTQSFRTHSQGEHGNRVHEMLFDYGGGRNIRLLRFAPAQNRIEAITWDTQNEQLVEKTEVVEDPGEARPESPPGSASA